MYDVIVVGAGPGGASAAYFLGQAGLLEEGRHGAGGLLDQHAHRQTEGEARRPAEIALVAAMVGPGEDHPGGLAESGGDADEAVTEDVLGEPALPRIGRVASRAAEKLGVALLGHGAS